MPAPSRSTPRRRRAERNAAPGAPRALRAGFALVPVVVLVSAMLLVALAFTDAVLHAMRGARTGWQGERATHAADAALLTALSAWQPTSAAALHAGETDTLATRTLAGLHTAVVRTRMQARLFAIEAVAFVGDGGVRPARRVVGRTVRLDWPRPPVLAVLTAAGAVGLGDRAVVLGADVVPAGWNDECALDARSEPMAAIAATTATVAAASIVVGAGAPVHALTPAARDDVIRRFDASYADLAAQATARTSAPVLSLDQREAAAPSCPLWLGDGARGAGVSLECSRRWPIVHATAVDHVELVGLTAGQGILLVDGDLVVREPITLHGLVLVRGRVRFESRPGEPAPQLTGALLVRDTAALGSVIDAVHLQGSQCAVRRALAAAGTPVPIGTHGWGERP